MNYRNKQSSTQFITHLNNIYDNINITGIATLNQGITTNFNITGVSTINQLQSTNLHVSGISTFVGIATCGVLTAYNSISVGGTDILSELSGKTSIGLAIALG